MASAASSMFPGMGGRIDPRRMNQMMKQLGIDVREMDGVQEVVIRTATRDYVFQNADVTIMRAQGQDTYQVVGKPEVREHEARLSIPDEDVKMVAQQSGKSDEQARAALEATKGDIAEAILRLQA